MIEPHRDLHNAQNPGVLVSDPIWSAFIGVFLVGIWPVVGTKWRAGDFELTSWFLGCGSVGQCRSTGAWIWTTISSA